MRITKDMMIQEIAKDADVSKADASRMINAFIDSIEVHVANGDEVNFVGFGKFNAVKRSPRMGRNPQTGAELMIPARIAPVFHAGKKFKEIVNK